MFQKEKEKKKKCTVQRDQRFTLGHDPKAEAKITSKPRPPPPPVHRSCSALLNFSVCLNWPHLHMKTQILICQRIYIYEKKSNLWQNSLNKSHSSSWKSTHNCRYSKSCTHPAAWSSCTAAENWFTAHSALISFELRLESNTTNTLTDRV